MFVVVVIASFKVVLLCANDVQVYLKYLCNIYLSVLVVTTLSVGTLNRDRHRNSNTHFIRQ